MKVPNALNRDDTVHGTYYYIASEADKIIDELRAENEQLRVQLAGCGVAALGNTEASKLQRAKPEDYGYSESYAEVCRAVDCEIEQHQVLEQALVALKSLFGTPDINTGAGGGGVAAWRLGGSHAVTEAISAIQEKLK